MSGRGEYQRRWREANKEKQAAYKKEYYVANKERLNATRKAWRQKTPQYWRRSYLKTHYGISPEKYQEMLLAQKGLCYICHLPPTGKPIKGQAPSLHVDHNHLTGEVRKLLCGKCNQAIGLLDEVPDRIRAAAAYLEEHDHEYSTY